LKVFDDPFAAGSTGGAFVPQLQASPKLQSFIATDDASRDRPKVTHMVPVGTDMILGFPRQRIGIKRPIKGRYKEIMVPMNHPMPEPPPGSDLKEWKVQVDLPVWLSAHGDNPASPRKWIIDGATNLRGISELYHMLSNKKEKQAGQVPVVRIAPFRTFMTPEYGTFGAFVLERSAGLTMTATNSAKR
jgi:hypothetical protein